jgi:hypothetical protein
MAFMIAGTIRTIAMLFGLRIIFHEYSPWTEMYTQQGYMIS